MFLLLCLTLLLLPFAELLRFQIVELVKLRFLDLLIFVFFTAYSIKKRFKLNLHTSFNFFSLTLFASFIYNLPQFNLPSLFYLLRTLLYLQIPLLLKKLKLNIQQKKVLKFLFLYNLLVLLFTGFVQYFFYPNLRNLIYLGYDPHLYRLFGLFLDPNLIGLVFLWFSFWVFHTYQKPYRWFLLLATLCSVLLTYSRATWATLIITTFYLVFKYKYYLKYWLVFLLLFLFSLILLPKRFGEGTKIIRTNSVVSKYQAWKQGLKFVAKKPLLGIGFNNLPLYKLYKSEKQKQDNAAFALDSSFLTILVTAGALGLFTYLYLFWSLFVKSSLYQQLFVLAFFIHALSTNSFFTPTVFVYFALFSQLPITQHK